MSPPSIGVDLCPPLREAAVCPAPRPAMDRRLQMERGTTQALAESASLQEAAPKILRALCETLGWAFGACWVIQPCGETMACMGTWTRDSLGLEAFRQATRQLKLSRNPGGLIRRAWLSGEAVWVHDVTADASFRRLRAARQGGLRSGFAFPIRTGTRVTGVMEFYSHEILQPDAELLDSTSYIGSQIGQFCDRAHAQEQLRETQEVLRAAFEHAAAGIAMLDRDGRWVRVNDALCRMLGYTQAELLALDPCEVTPADERGSLHGGLLPAGLPAGQPCERRYLHRDGQIVWATVCVNAVLGPDGQPGNQIAVISDITQRKRAQQLQHLEHAVTRCLAESEDAATALRAVIQAVCRTEGWACGEYWCLDSARSVLRFGGYWSSMGPQFDQIVEQSRNMEFAPGVGLAGRVLQSGQPLWIADVGVDPRIRRREFATQGGLHGAFVFPVLAGAETLGVLAFWSQAIREPDQALLDGVHAIGSQVGQFLRRKQAEEVLRESEQRFHDQTIELAAIGVAHIAPDGRFIHVSRWLCKLLGYPRDELLAMHCRHVTHDEDRAAADEQRAALLAGQQEAFQLEQRWQRKDGTSVWVGLSSSLKHAPDGTPLHEICMVQDISARKQADEHIKYLATHDGLTGLPNRAMFTQLLRHTLEAARRYERRLAVLFIDLDRFKIINDTLGHEAGDQLLCAMAERLRGVVRASDVAARLGGDEFVVLLEEVQGPAGVTVVAQALLAAILKPLRVGGRECRVTASIGIAMYPEDASDAQALMKNADIAMYAAKEEGKNTFQFYSDARCARPQALQRMAVETALRGALERGEFSLQYQPKVELRGNSIVGAEALLRWNNPELGSVPPSLFIPVAEETGLIVPIGKWVLRTACAQAMVWQRQGLPGVCMAVNLSPRQFNEPELLGDIAAALRDSGLAPARLELEITESLVMQDPDRAVAILDAIKKMGVRLAIDDFGTGYSSLAQLKRFPIDTLKVDRSFVRDISVNAEDQAITAAIIAMGRTLNLTVVAEGVETQEQKAFLQARDCDQMQGYFFSRPVPASKFADLLRTHCVMALHA